MIKVDSRINFLKEVSKHLPEKSICVELGVFRGDFSPDILKILMPKVLHLIDPFEVGNDKNGVVDYATLGKTAYSNDKDYINVITRFSNEIKSGQVVVGRNYSYDAVNKFPNKYFDFIYIDACHLYESVKCDLRDYLPKLKETGF